MADEGIRDLPQHKKAVAEAEGVLAIAKLAKTFEPFLPAKARAALADLDIKKLEGMLADMDKLRNLPDRFNAHFAARGWIAWEDMNYTVSLAAVELADNGKIAEAEEVLVAYWTSEIIDFHIMRLKRVEAFIPRWRLAKDAQERYNEGRYNAATLLILSVLDGMVQEVSAKHLGINQNFSAEKTELIAWDSIAGHSSGLNKLKEIMLQPRKKINTEPITIPYRHGIVHGMDVNYNHKIVAAKAWAALFAVGQWAYLAQKKALAEPSPEKPKSLIEQLKEAARTQVDLADLDRTIKNFKPRDEWKQGNIPPRGKPEDYAEGSPERALVQFLSWWQSGNYGRMATSITTISEPAHPGDLRAWFGGKELLEFELTSVDDQAPARTVVGVKLRLRDRRTQKVVEGLVEVVLTKKIDEASVDALQAAPWTFFDYYSLTRPKASQG